MNVAPAGHFQMIFNVYDSKVTMEKGGAHVTLYWISSDSEMRKTVGNEKL